MAHAIEIEPNNFKKGDRVQHLDTGWFATVAEDQNKGLFVKIIWDKSHTGPAEEYMAEAFRVAPWHGINIKDLVRHEVLTEDAVPPMDDKAAATVLADLLERRVADIPKLEKKLADENAEYERDPHPLTARIIEISTEKAVRARLEAEALAVALKKF